MRMLLPNAKKWKKDSKNLHYSIALFICRYLDRRSIEPSPLLKNSLPKSRGGHEHNIHVISYINMVKNFISTKLPRWSWI